MPMNESTDWPSTSQFRPLNGLWDFAFLGAIELDSFRLDPRLTWGKALVPSAFDVLPAHAGQRGAAVYRTEFVVPAGQYARLEFGAVSMWARVSVDGRILREHACGYAPFTVDVPPDPERTTRTLVVLVDNRFDFTRVPMHDRPFDFYQYGGILREVCLRLLPPNAAFIDSVHITPTADYAAGGIEVTVDFGGPVPASVALCFDGDADSVSIPAGAVSGGAFRFAVRVPTPRIWSPASPALHRLRVTLLDADGTPTDSRTVRFGLRRIEAREGKLWLNGEPLILRGYNRHEWHPSFGPCTPPLQMAADLQLLRDLGCNFVRGSHYPQDQRFLDLCDELGFLVWEENLGWGQREKVLTDAKFHRDHAETLRAMVRASFNHPSVIIWGFLNEAGTHQAYSRPIFEQSVSILRALDPSRLVSYATMFAKDDLHYDLVDLISINIYPGWYGCEDAEQPLDLIVPAMRECFASIDARGFADKPVIVSEIGAEGLYGWHDPHGDFFTEEHQAAYLRRACEESLGNARCSGVVLWQFSDVRTYGGGRALMRPRTFNNKGTLDEYRRPKVAYSVVREIFRTVRDTSTG